MKHPVSTTALLLLLFVAAQVVGIALLAKSSTVTNINGVTEVEYPATAIGERPALEGGGAFLYLIIGIAIGTVLLLFLIKLRAFSVWKVWFLVAVWLATTVAVGVLIPTTIALIVCLIAAAWKVYRPNPLIHNMTEVFMYAGIALLLVPLFHGSIGWVLLMLLVISIYDMVAVWYSKHMVTMATEQSKNNLFAGLSIPKKETTSSMRKTLSKSITVSGKISGKTLPKPEAPRVSAAVLGGGDIAFPLIFSGVVLDWLIMRGASKTVAMYESLIIVAGATIALGLLFFYAKKDRFYPAMPFISAGCLVGFGIIMML